MSEWIGWIQEVAAERVDSIERGLRQNPRCASRSTP